MSGKETTISVTSTFAVTSPGNGNLPENIPYLTEKKLTASPQTTIEYQHYSSESVVEPTASSQVIKQDVIVTKQEGQQQGYCKEEVKRVTESTMLVQEPITTTVVNSNQQVVESYKIVEQVTATESPQAVKDNQIVENGKDLVEQPNADVAHKQVVDSQYRSEESVVEQGRSVKPQHVVEYQYEDKSWSENEPLMRTDVMREADNRDEEEYPEEGLAKNLLSKFKSLESEAHVTKAKEFKPSGLGFKNTMRPTVSRIDASHAIDIEDDMEVGAPGGVYESQPIIRSDVVKEEHRNDEEELPPAGLTRTLLSTFKQIEKSGESTPVKQLSRVPSNASSIADALSLYNEASGGCSENSPLVRDDVVRESDPLAEVEELPVEGTTKNLLGMFSKVTENTQKMTQALHKPSGVAQKQWKSKNPRVKTVSSSSAATSEPATPDQRTDIVREDDENANEEELPKSGYAKGLLQKFKSMEAADKGNTSILQLAWSAGPPKSKTPENKEEAKDTCEIIQQTSTVEMSKSEVTEVKIEQRNITVQPFQKDTLSVSSPESKDDVKIIEMDSPVQPEKSSLTPDSESTSSKLTMKAVEMKTVVVKPVVSHAMSRFREMEQKTSAEIEHKPSKAASKPLRGQAKSIV